MNFFTFIKLKQFKKTIILVLVFLLFFIFPSIQKNFYQKLYGKKTDELLTDVPCQSVIKLIENAQQEEITLQNYTINYVRRADIELVARVVFIDRNDTFLSSFDYYSNELYDTISPIDISVFIGSMADNWNNYQITHEKRAMFIIRGTAVTGEFENLHIIPASTSVFAGLKTIKAGDIIALKGFLIDWSGTEEFSYFNVQTALSFNDASKQKIGGNFTWLCMQFFVTELRTNGYVFN